MDDEQAGDGSDQQWETVRHTKGKRKNKKRAAKQRDQGAELQFMAGPSAGNKKSIKDMAKDGNANTAGQGA